MLSTQTDESLLEKWSWHPYGTWRLDWHKSAKRLIVLSHWFAYADSSYTQQWAIQSGLYTICVDWSRAPGYFSWTLHKTGGCWLRSFISSQPPQAEAGHLLSLTYVLYKPRQCPTNTVFLFFSGKVSLSLANCLLCFPRREWIVLANTDRHQRGITLKKVKNRREGET